MKINIFDVLIVYSEGLATTANALNNKSLLPFAKGSDSESYNLVYGYFLNVCRKNGLKAAFTTSADIIGPGTCRSYWLHKGGDWIRAQETGYAEVIFDKCSPVSEKIKNSRSLLFSSRKIKPFNRPEIFDLFFDKQKTYDKLHQFSIPTATIQNGNLKSVNKACKILEAIIRKHPHRKDFSNEIILKDRFGAGGLHVYKYKINQTDKILKKLKRYSHKSFIIQSFVNFDKGYSYKNIPVSTDIRLIYLGGEIIQTYIRMARARDFRCNEHQGGTLKYISKNQVPTNVLLASSKIARVLNHKSSLYSLDFIVSNNGNAYLLEGNTGPGLDWNLSIAENRIQSQKLIRIIVKELLRKTIPPVATTDTAAVELIFDTPTTDKYPLISNETSNELAFA